MHARNLHIGYRRRRDIIILYYCRPSTSYIIIVQCTRYMLCCMLNAWFHQPCAWGSVFSFIFILPQRIVRKEPILDCFQHMYRRGDAENFGSVCLMVREKIGLQTDRRTRRIHKRLFSDEKSAKNQLGHLEGCQMGEGCYFAGHQ